MSTQQVKKVIKKRFGSISEFARQAGLDRYELQKLFALKKPDPKKMADVERKATRLEAKAPERALRASDVESLKTALMKAGGVMAFCGENKGFQPNSIYQVLNGRVKNKSPMVERLFKAAAVPL